MLNYFVVKMPFFYWVTLLHKSGNFIKVYNLVELQEAYSLVSLSSISEIKIEAIMNSYVLSVVINGELSHIYGANSFDSFSDAHTALKLLDGYMCNKTSTGEARRCMK